ncbi:MAG: hemolysin III family protein [Acidimicrobiia bacterium]
MAGVVDSEVAPPHIQKPRLRGWLHAVMFPISVIAGMVLVMQAETPEAQISAAIFATTAALLFGTSALFHRGSWSPRVRGLLRRMDHSNIYLIIAGTYTPFAVLSLPPGKGQTLLLIVWVGALAGVIFRVFWIGAPRWLYTSVYVGIGWVAIFFLPALIAGAGVTAVLLIAVGGVLYSAGAVVYGLKRPDPWPRWFGFHEVFHSLTIAAFTVHYVAVSIVVYP